MSAEEDLEFSMKLIDEMTGPSMQAYKALGNVEMQLKHIDREMAKIERAKRFSKMFEAQQGGASSAEVLQSKLAFIRGELKEQDKVQDAAAKSAGMLGANVGGWVQAFGAAYQQVSSMTHALTGLVTGLARFGVAQATETENTRRYLSFVTGSAAAGEALQRKFAEMGRNAGGGSGALAKGFTQLHGLGMKDTEINYILGRMLDVRAVQGGAAGESASQTFLSTIVRNQQMMRGRGSSGGMMAVRSLEHLLTPLGVSRDDIIRQLAKNQGVKGVPIEQLRQQMLSQQFNGSQINRALLDVLNTKFGSNVAGKYAFEAPTKGIEAAMAKFHETIKALADEIDLSPFTKMMGRITKALEPDSASGQKLKATYAQLFEKAADAIEGFISDPTIIIGTIDKITDAVVTAADMLASGMQLAGDFATAFAKAFASGDVDRANGGMKEFGQAAAESRKAVATIGTALGEVAKAVHWVVTNFEKLLSITKYLPSNVVTSYAKEYVGVLGGSKPLQHRDKQEKAVNDHYTPEMLEPKGNDHVSPVGPKASEVFGRPDEKPAPAPANITVPITIHTAATDARAIVDEIRPEIERQLQSLTSGFGRQ